jgi:CIC family chloride channel protein
MKGLPELLPILSRHWRPALRLRGRFQPREETFHLALAGIVGVIGGLANLAYYHATDSLKLFFLHYRGDPVEVAELLNPWLRVLIPTAGGLIAGLVLQWGLRFAGPRRSTNLLEVVVAGDGRLPFRSGVIKTISSLVSIGSGASIGREGGIVQLSATLASKGGQVLGYQPYRLRLLVGCGAAAGIAAAYNAPISGAIFAATIVLGSFSMSTFAPLVFASVISTVLSRTFFGIRPWYTVPDFDVTHLGQLPWFIVLGIVAGWLGASFLLLLRWSETSFRKLRLPAYVRLTLGGLAVGIIAIGFPGVWGNGYTVTNRFLLERFPADQIPLLFVLGLLAAKMIATAAAVGAGTVGGVFTPTLFLGAGLGSAFGMTLHQLGQADAVPLPAFALVGMGSMLAATTHSPLLAMIMIFEISLNYSLMPPLMLACTVSVILSRQLHTASVYTEPLLARGLNIDRDTTGPEDSTARTVGDMMRAPVTSLSERTPLAEIAHRFLASTNNYLPVVDDKERLVGVVALQDMKEYLRGHQEMAVIAHDIMRTSPPCVTPDQTLIEAFPAVVASEQRNIPVVSSLREKRLVGSVRRSEVLGLLSETIAHTRQPGGLNR